MNPPALLVLSPEALPGLARPGAVVERMPQGLALTIGKRRLCLNPECWTAQAQAAWDWAFPSAVAEESAECPAALMGDQSRHRLAQGLAGLCPDSRTLRLAFRLTAPLFVERLGLVGMGPGGWRARLDEWAQAPDPRAALQGASQLLHRLFGLRSHPRHPGLGGAIFPPDALDREWAGRAALQSPPPEFWQGMAALARELEFAPGEGSDGWLEAAASPLALEIACRLAIPADAPRASASPVQGLLSALEEAPGLAAKLKALRSHPPVRIPDENWALAGRIRAACALLQSAQGRVTLPDLRRIIVVDASAAAQAAWVQEGQRVEFKSAYEFDPRTGRRNGALRLGVMRALCAFLNSGGGDLYIGLRDDGSVCGLEGDLQLAGGEDALELRIREHAAKSLHPRPLGLLESEFIPADGGLLLRLRCRPSHLPVTLTWKDESTGASRSARFMRDGNRSVAVQPGSAS